MSALEPLAALSLACNIFQSIAFGAETIKLIKNLRRTGSFDTALSRQAEVLGDISSQLQSLPPSVNPTPDEQRLFHIAGDCATVAKELQDEIASLAAYAAKSGFVATLKVVPRTMWKKRRLDALQHKLGQAEAMMQNGLLARTCNRFNAAHASLEALDGRLRSFWDQYNQGHDKAMQLVSQEASVTRQHIGAESVKTRSEVKSHLTTELKKSEQNVREDVRTVADNSTRDITGVLNNMRLNAYDDSTRLRLLKSLKFDGMNERRNQVVPADISTFRWIFQDNDSYSSLCSDEENLLIASDIAEFGSDDEKGDTHHAEWDSFTEWLRSDAREYWISGKPGSGKTTLVNYILSEPMTAVQLGHLGSDYIVLSHFFWRPGSPMQQNIKGMLCSLLYQLLKADESMIDRVLTNPDVQHIDSDSDWSVDRLQAALLDVIRCYDKAICIFLDGLDEVDPKDGVIKLFTAIRLIGNAGKVKICMSSRPEPLIQDYLKKHPRLRLQDLSRLDLSKYAQNHLEFPDISSDTSGLEKKDLLKMLVDKAEGVFLWLCLAIKSINRGLRYDDNLEHMKLRVNSLSGDLKALYQDMWERMNDDKQIYQQSAALYFKLALANQRFYAMNPTTADEKEICLLPMMLITTGLSREILEQRKQMMSVQEILALCQRTIKEVEVRCAGLLEFYPPKELELSGKIHQDNRADDEAQGMKFYISVGSKLFDLGRDIFHGNHPCWTENFGASIPFVNLHWPCHFIHRTAHDFFLETTEGKDILSHDSTSDEQLFVKLAETTLATYQSIADTSTVSWDDSVSEKAAESCLYLISRIAEYPSIDMVYLKQEQKRLATLCQKLFIGRSGKQYSFFLLVAASLGLYDFVLDRVQIQAPLPDYKSTLLETIHLRLRYNVVRGSNEDAIKLFLWLLEDGAQVDSDRSLWFAIDDHQLDCQKPFRSFLSGNLRALWNRKLAVGSYYSLLQTTSAFVRSGADLIIPIYLFFFLGYEDDLLSSMDAVDLPTALLFEHYSRIEGLAIYSIPAFLVIQAFIQQSKHEESLGLASFNKAEVDFLESQRPRTRFQLPRNLLHLFKRDRDHSDWFHKISIEDSDHLTEVFLSMLGRPTSREDRKAFDSLCCESLSTSKRSGARYLVPIGLLDIYDNSTESQEFG